MEELREAVEATVDRSCIDNWDTVYRCATPSPLLAGRVPLEASGNMTVERRPGEVAATGVGLSYPWAPSPIRHGHSI